MRSIPPRRSMAGPNLAGLIGRKVAGDPKVRLFAGAAAGARARPRVDRGGARDVSRRSGSHVPRDVDERAGHPGHGRAEGARALHRRSGVAVAEKLTTSGSNPADNVEHGRLGASHELRSRGPAAGRRAQISGRAFTGLLICTASPGCWRRSSFGSWSRRRGAKGSWLRPSLSFSSPPACSCWRERGSTRGSLRLPSRTVVSSTSAASYRERLQRCRWTRSKASRSINRSSAESSITAK